MSLLEPKQISISIYSMLSNVYWNENYFFLNMQKKKDAWGN